LDTFKLYHSLLDSSPYSRLINYFWGCRDVKEGECGGGGVIFF
jgi:hypothetical protein